MGSDAASTRYTYTKIMDYTRMIFDERDEPILTQAEIEGQKIEWETYAPILCMVLINGCNGIATGYRKSPVHERHVGTQILTHVSFELQEAKSHATTLLNRLTT